MAKYSFSWRPRLWTRLSPSGYAPRLHALPSFSASLSRVHWYAHLLVRSRNGRESMEAHIWEILIGFLWTVFAFVAGIVTHWQATREHRRSSDVPVSENRHTTSS